MKTVLATLIAFFSVSAMAAEYGDAGCGLGSIVMGSEKGAKQVLAATTNATGVQTFGITTGTSNCSEGGIMKAEHKVPAFIEMNKLALAKDAARGEGETLSGLANLMGCHSNSFGQSVKANYKNIFVDSNMEPMEIQHRIQSATQNSCGA